MRKVIILTFIFCLTAEISGASFLKEKKVSDDQLLQFEHKNFGCPLNSLCSKKTGHKRVQWMQALKKSTKSLKKIHKKLGSPLKMWLIKNISNEADYILWDSHCQNHNISNEEIYKIEIFTKDLNNINNKNIFLPYAWLLTKNEDILPIFNPIDEYPAIIDGDSFRYNLFEEGKYFGMQISRKGIIKITKTYFPEKMPQDTTCPVKLTQFFQSQKFPKNLYQSHFCRNIWNKKTKNYQKVLFGWSCN